MKTQANFRIFVIEINQKNILIMTILEKRQAFIKKIQEILDDLLDKAIDFVENISAKEDLDKADFEQYLKETTLKYKKVWEALA